MKRFVNSVVRYARTLNPMAWLMLFASVGVFIAMNVASFERYESEEIWLSVGWPLVFWTKMQGTFIVASHTRYENLIANAALVGIVASASVALAQSYARQFSIRAVFGLTFFIALIVSIANAFDALENAVIVMYLSPAILVIVVAITRRFQGIQPSIHDSANGRQEN